MINLKQVLYSLVTIALTLFLVACSNSSADSAEYFNGYIFHASNDQHNTVLYFKDNGDLSVIKSDGINPGTMPGDVSEDDLVEPETVYTNVSIE